MQGNDPANTRKESRGGNEPLEASRLVGFSDGVFAVAITLLGPLGYLAAIAASYLNIYAGIAIYVVAVSLYVPPPKLSEV